MCHYCSWPGRARAVREGGSDCWVIVMDTDPVSENGDPDGQRTGVPVTAKV